MASVHELSGTSLAKLISFIFWGGLYIQSTVNWPGKPPEWSSRLVTLLHGSVATIVGLSQCGIMNLTTWRLNMKLTPKHYALMVWSWGYFAFDLLWCLVYQSEGRLIVMHHVSALVAITVYMQKTYTGCTFACNLAMMEITNPLLQTRWFLKYEGYEKTTLFNIVEVSYLVMFLIVRGVFGTYLIFRTFESDMFDWDEKIISLVFYFVSIALLYDVMGYIIHRYRSKIGVLAIIHYAGPVQLGGCHMSSFVVLGHAGFLTMFAITISKEGYRAMCEL